MFKDKIKNKEIEIRCSRETYFKDNILYLNKRRYNKIKNKLPKNFTNINITILGSCRQSSLKEIYNVNNIQENLSYPHYTKEIIQCIEFCKNLKSFKESKNHIFRTPIINKNYILNQDEIVKEFKKTDIVVIEIATKKYFKYNNNYVHHILIEEKYNFPDREKIEQGELDDESIEKDLIKIKNLLFDKIIIIVPHIYTRENSKRYKFVNFLKKICNDNQLYFLNISQNLNLDKNFERFYEKEQQLNHLSDEGHSEAQNIYKNFIDNLVRRKKIIHIWKQKCKNNLNSFWGLGDMIRGTVYAYQFCLENNYDFFLSLQNHPCSKYLREGNDIFYDKDVNFYPEINKKNIYKDFNFLNINGTLETWNNKNLIIKQFLLKRLIPNKKIEEKIKNFESFYALHIRLKDDEDYLDLEKIKKIFKIIPDNKNYILFTNNILLKNKINQKNIKILNTKPEHFGKSENLEDTMFEFFLISKAKKIYSFNYYDWTSGFVKSIEYLYDVEVIPYNSFFNN